MARRIPTAQQLTTLVALIKLKAGHKYVGISSSSLGESLGLSQQAASKRLLELESSGMIERMHGGRGLSVRLTDGGLEAVRWLYGELRVAFEDERRDLTFRGNVFTGFKEGRYYVSLKGYAKHFRTRLGFEPFPGTLNLRLTSPIQIEQRRQLQFLKGIDIAGFEDADRSYGPVKCFRAEIEGKHPGAVLAIERTHYDNSVLEVISPVNLRKLFRLRDGDECSVRAYLE